MLGLRMACCDAAAIPVDLPNGTRFVRHHADRDCGTESESLEHQAIKANAAVAAQAAGWSVAIEGKGTAPEGEKWRADVLCTRGDRQVALEIQMSHQTLEEYRRRQAIYARSGVEGVWFAGHKGVQAHRSTADLPIFPIHLRGLNADVAVGRGRSQDPRIPVEQFVGEYLEGLWHCREPIAAPAAIIPELTVCLDCGREIMNGASVAAFPAEADPTYPPGPIFAALSSLDIKDTSLTRAAWSMHRIVAPLRKGVRCPYCAGRLRASVSFTPDRLCNARHVVEDRHGTILLSAGGWWRRGQPLLPRGWHRPTTPPEATIPLSAIIDRSRSRLLQPFLEVRARRQSALSAIEAAIFGRPGWKAFLDEMGESWDGDDPGQWMADIVLRQEGPGGRHIAFFLAIDHEALPLCRLFAQRAMREFPDATALLLSPVLDGPGFTKRVLDMPMTGGSPPLVSVNGEMMTLTRFVADLTRGSIVVKTSALLPYTLLPVPASCPSCGRIAWVEAYAALHIGEVQDDLLGRGIAVVPAPRAWSQDDVVPVAPRYGIGRIRETECVCGTRMLTGGSEGVLDGCGDLQVRHGRWQVFVGPLVRRGEFPRLPNAIGQAKWRGVSTLDDWKCRIMALSPPPDGDAVRKRKAAIDSVIRGATATGWPVDTSRCDDGIVLVNSPSARKAIAVLASLPGPEAAGRLEAEIKSATAAMKEAGVETVVWLSMIPVPPLPYGQRRRAILLGWLEDAAYALPASDDSVPLDHFVHDILEGGWEFIADQTFSLTLVLERVLCSHCGAASIIAPWCAATAADRPAPAFARILGARHDGAGFLPLDIADSLRRSAERRLPLPWFQVRDGMAVQTCSRCGSVLAPTLSAETLQRHWAGPGIGSGQAVFRIHRWVRRGEAILGGPLTVPGRPTRERMPLEQWFAIAAQEAG